MVFRKIITLITLYIFCSLGLQAQKKEADAVTANLRFNLWVVHKAEGLQVSGKGKGERGALEKHRGSFYYKNGEEYVEVKYSQGRRSAQINYQGPKKCVFYLKTTGEIPYKEVFQLNITRSGEYLAILRTSGNAKDPKIEPCLIPHGGSSLKTGHVLFLNQTKRTLGLLGNGEKRVILKPGASNLVKLDEGDSSGLHLEVHEKEEKSGKVGIALSKAYSLNHKTKSVCILYNDRASEAVKLKFFSGIK